MAHRTQRLHARTHARARARGIIWRNHDTTPHRSWPQSCAAKQYTLQRTPNESSHTIRAAERRTRSGHRNHSPQRCIDLVQPLRCCRALRQRRSEPLGGLMSERRPVRTAAKPESCTHKDAGACVHCGKRVEENTRRPHSCHIAAQTFEQPTRGFVALASRGAAPRTRPLALVCGHLQTHARHTRSGAPTPLRTTSRHRGHTVRAKNNRGVQIQIQGSIQTLVGLVTYPGGPDLAGSARPQAGSSKIQRANDRFSWRPRQSIERG